LPPRLARDPASEQLALDFQVVDRRPHAAQFTLDWPDFEEPVLLSLRGARVAVMLSRVAAFGWSIAAVVFALQARSETGPSVGIHGLLRVGLVVALASACTGWIWSDRATRNLHRLGGRLPNRTRCLSAWSLPVACAVLLWFTVLRMEPTDVVDVRPAIVGTLMAITIWRPYSLIRRILATLTRVRSDAAIGAGYVLDLSAFGLLWWQLSDWPSSGQPFSAGQADVLLGASAAAAVGFGLNIVTWAFIVHDVDVAEDDRVLALRTRHDHRNLRLRGINPMDPDVRWALLRIRQEEEYERRAAAPPTHQTVASVAHPAAAPPVVEQHPDTPWINPSPSDTDAPVIRVAQPEDSSGVPVAESQTGLSEPIEDETLVVDPVLLERGMADALAEEPPADEPVVTPPEVIQGPTTESEPVDAPVTLVAELLDSEAGEQIIADLVGEIASTEVSAKLIADLADEVAAEEVPEIAAQPPAAVAEEGERAATGADIATDQEDKEERKEEGDDAPSREDALAADPTAELAARLRARLGSERERRTAARSYPTIQPTDREDSVSRLARRLDSAGAATPHAKLGSPSERIAAATAAGLGDEDLVSRRDRFAQRLNDPAGGGPSERTLLQRLEEYGITPSSTSSEPVAAIADEFRQEEDRWIPPRLYELEAVRYLLLIGLVVVAVTSGWIVMRAVTAGSELVGGDIAPGDLDRINVARRAFVTALGVTLTLVVLWCAVFLSHARRAGAPDAREWRGYALLVVVVALNIAAFVVDGEERGDVSLACLLGSLASACVGVACVAPIVRWFDRRTLALMVWTAGLVVVTIMSWLGGLQHPIEPNQALEALTFVAAVQAIGAAICVVIAALSTSDIEDAIRLSPAMAEVLLPSPHHSTPDAGAD
jgi:hypothetical protein